MFEVARREIDLTAAHVDARLDRQHVGVVRPLRDRRRDVRERIGPLPALSSTSAREASSTGLVGSIIRAALRSRSAASSFSSVESSRPRNVSDETFVGSMATAAFAALSVSSVRVCASNATDRSI